MVRPSKKMKHARKANISGRNQTDPSVTNIQDAPINVTPTLENNSPTNSNCALLRLNDDILVTILRYCLNQCDGNEKSRLFNSLSAVCGKFQQLLLSGKVINFHDAMLFRLRLNLCDRQLMITKYVQHLQTLGQKAIQEAVTMLLANHCDKDTASTLVKLLFTSDVFHA